MDPLVLLYESVHDDISYEVSKTPIKNNSYITLSTGFINALKRYGLVFCEDNDDAFYEFNDKAAGEIAMFSSNLGRFLVTSMQEDPAETISDNIIKRYTDFLDQQIVKIREIRKSLSNSHNLDIDI